MVKIRDIAVGERARKMLSGPDNTIEQLTESIRDNGLINPIAVKEGGPDGFGYTLLAGARRLNACSSLGWEHIPVNVFPIDVTEFESKSIELQENIARLPMTWSEKNALTKQVHDMMVDFHGIPARGIRTDLDQKKVGWTVADTAKLLGVSKATAATSIEMAKMLEAVPSLRKIKNKTDAANVLKKILKGELTSARATEVEKVKDNRVEKLLSSYRTGDAIEGLRECDSNFADLVILDPPFAIDLREARTHTGPAFSTSDYVEIEVENYPPFMSSLLTESFRVLKPSGWLVCWFGYDHHALVLSLIREAGFTCSSIPALWLKSRGQTKRPEYYFASAHEPFFYARKSNEAKLACPGILNHFQTFDIPTIIKRHPTEKPVELCSRIILSIIGARKEETILVPCLGSGNDLLAANNIGHTAFGWEISKPYRDSFVAYVGSYGPRPFSSIL